MLTSNGHPDEKSQETVDRKNQVFKLTVKKVRQSKKNPALKDPPYKTNATAFVVDVNQIAQQLNVEKTPESLGLTPRVLITNAHCVHQASIILIKHGGSSQLYEFEAKYVAHDTDLAILIIKDHKKYHEFFKDTIPLELATKLHEVGEQVMVLGFPTNGELSHTEGRISRYEAVKGAHGNINKLTLEFSAEVNPGSSGGPVIKYSSNEVTSIVHQMSTASTQKLCFSIPALSLLRVFNCIFLYGQYYDSPGAPFHFEQLKEPELRASYGLTRDGGDGVLITTVFPLAANYFQPGDVLISIAGHPIDSEGKLSFPGLSSGLLWTSILDLHSPFDTINFVVIRVGQEITIPFTCGRSSDGYSRHRMVPTDIYEFFLYSGLLFTPSTQEHIASFITKTGNSTPVDIYRAIGEGYKTDMQQELVLMQDLTDNSTYRACNTTMVVREINGCFIKSFAHLRRVLHRIEKDHSVQQLRITIGSIATPTIVVKKLTSDENKTLASKNGLFATELFAPVSEHTRSKRKRALTRLGQIYREFTKRDEFAMNAQDGTHESSSVAKAEGRANRFKQFFFQEYSPGSSSPAALSEEKNDSGSSIFLEHITNTRR